VNGSRAAGTERRLPCHRAAQKNEQVSVTAPATSEQLHESDELDCIVQLQLNVEHGVGVMQDQFSVLAVM
jgi:hypothetical protein